MIRIFILFWLLVPFTLWAQKHKNYTAVIQELVKKITEANVPARPLRLAVVPFSATQSSSQASPQFGEYLTETIIGSLTGEPEKIKLFERTRLDAILKEHEFILTDLMKPAAALKIGQLAPIDALLSGTYTKLKSYTDISARLIDVTSGEILSSYNGRIKMTKNLESLFQNGVPVNTPNTVNTTNQVPINVTINNSINTSGSTVKSKKEICDEKVKEFRTRLNDLSTPEKVNLVVLEAVKNPFDNLCGRLHYDVIYSFSRFKIEQPDYETFLLRTLDTIAYPAADERASEIIRYLGNDGIDEQEWKSGLSALTKVGNYSLSTYVSYLIGKYANIDQGIAEFRVRNYFQKALAQQIGLPRPVSFEVAYQEMMEGLSGSESMRQFVYKNYSSRLMLDNKLRPVIFTDLSSMYKHETTPSVKSEIIVWLADFVNKEEYEKAHEQLYEFARSFELTSYEARNEEIKREFPEADLKILVSRCEKRFSNYAMLTPYKSQQEDRINFCVKYSIPVPGAIPTMPEAETILKGSDLTEQLRVIKLLARMERRPASLENTLVQLLSKKTLEDKEKLTQIQAYAVTVLGNIRSVNAVALNYMISNLMSYNYQESDAAMHALIAIGKPAVAPLTARLDKTTEQDGGLQYKLITILGKIGKDADSAGNSLQKILNKSANSDVRYAVEAALQAIKQ